MNLASLRTIIGTTEWHRPAPEHPLEGSAVRHLEFDFFIAVDDIELRRTDIPEDAEHSRLTQAVLHRNFLAPLSWVTDETLVLMNLTSAGHLTRAWDLHHHEFSYRGSVVETITTYKITPTSPWFPMFTGEPFNVHGAPELHVDAFAFDFARRRNANDTKQLARFDEFVRAATVHLD